MYTFTIKDNGPELDIVITRAMLTLAAIAAFVYRTEAYYFINVLASILLFIAAVFINLLLVKLKLNKFIVLSGAAIILFIATHSIAFAVILLVYGYLVKYLNKKPMILVTNEGITIKKFFESPAYPWNEFSNIILKDSLLSLDFNNNKLFQINIDESKTVVDENEFNDFCKSFILPQ